MDGYIVRFYTCSDRRHHGKPLGDWLVHLASEMNLPGATLIPASEGIGRGHRLHSMHFFELADQPLLVQMAVTHAQCEQLFERLEAEQVRVFYVKSPAEFGMLGACDDAACETSGASGRG
jgi:uncharacterized protein